MSRDCWYKWIQILTPFFYDTWEVNGWGTKSLSRVPSTPASTPKLPYFGLDGRSALTIADTPFRTSHYINDGNLYFLFWKIATWFFVLLHLKFTFRFQIARFPYLFKPEYFFMVNWNYHIAGTLLYFEF